MNWIIILAIAAGGLALYAVAVYNRLVGLRQRTREATMQSPVGKRDEEHQRVGKMVISNREEAAGGLPDTTGGK